MIGDHHDAQRKRSGGEKDDVVEAWQPKCGREVSNCRFLRDRATNIRSPEATGTPPQRAVLMRLRFLAWAHVGMLELASGSLATATPFSVICRLAGALGAVGTLAERLSETSSVTREKEPTTTPFSTMWNMHACSMSCLGGMWARRVCRVDDNQDSLRNEYQRERNYRFYFILFEFLFYTFEFIICTLYTLFSSDGAAGSGSGGGGATAAFESITAEGSRTSGATAVG